jgi:hypothetical protein
VVQAIVPAITTKLANHGLRLGLGLALSVGCKPAPVSVAPDASPVEDPAPMAEPEPEPELEPEPEPEPKPKPKPKPKSSAPAEPAATTDPERTVLCCTSGSGRGGVGCLVVPSARDCSGGFMLTCTGYSCNGGDCACFD